MSGGSMDYLCFRVEEAAEGMLDPVMNKVVADIADVLHDLEWCTSGDISLEEYLGTVKKFKEKWLKPESEVQNENKA